MNRKNLLPSVFIKVHLTYVKMAVKKTSARIHNQEQEVPIKSLPSSTVNDVMTTQGRYGSAFVTLAVSLEKSDSTRL